MSERRHKARGHFDFLTDALYATLRALGRRAMGFYTAFGIFLVVGIVVAVAGTFAFAKLAGDVRSGSTQAFDDSVMTWLGTHRIAWVERSLLEITALGTGLVVLTIVGVAALFLALTQHRYSAFLLLLATGGGIVLNSILKLTFARPRPQAFTWVTHASSSSFPSGHAMSSAIVYFTVAYLAARLEPRVWQRALTMFVALALVALICISRLYLGVHYPSDVLAGVIIGLAWAGFCMAGLEAARVLSERFRQPMEDAERDLSTAERRAAGLTE
ncbi:MAG: phosphatase PAP2 family protein [Gemmatimonadaceae bacterium]